jgi:hypothetical protein
MIQDYLVTYLDANGVEHGFVIYAATSLAAAVRRFEEANQRGETITDVNLIRPTPEDAIQE